MSNDTPKPAILPAADLDDLRDRYVTRRIPDHCIEGAPDDVRALLAHVDALTAGDVDEASRIALGRELIGADRPIPCPKCGKPVRLPDEATDGELGVGECLTCEEDVDIEATVVIAWNVA